MVYLTLWTISFILFSRVESDEIHNGKYLESKVLVKLNNCGPTKCKRECIRHSGCTSINYIRDKLYCELLEVSRADRVVEKRGYSYSESLSWSIQENDPCWLSKCTSNQKCIITNNNQQICVKFAPYGIGTCGKNETYLSGQGCTCRGIERKVSLRDCGDVTGARGIYVVYPDSGPGCIEAYCNMDTTGGGWTVFQRRIDGSVDFYRGWYDYKVGFGNLTTEFWLGNENIHKLTAAYNYTLRVELEDFDGVKKYAEYSVFKIGNEDSNYRLDVGGYSGNAVCKIAGKKCEITVQPFEDCVRTVRDKLFPGIGIMSQWYDACVGYTSIPERTNSMAFTLPYTRSVATFIVAPGNPRSFDPFNVSSSVIGDALAYHNGMMFSTKDVDDDRCGYCAVRYHGAWWYNCCHDSNLNAAYLAGTHSSSSVGINWKQWRGFYYSMKSTQMMIRR